MKTFVLLHEFQDSFNMLSDDEAGQLIKAIFIYETTGEEPCFEDRAMTMAFLNIKRFLDTNRENYEKMCKQRSEYAKKRWEKLDEKEKTDDKGDNAEACISIQKDASTGNTNTNSNSNVKPNVKSDVNVKSNTDVNADAPVVQSTDKESIHTHKNTYGEFKNVFLSDEEYRRLKERFPDALNRIDSLSAYMKSTGKAYLDHYAQLINWHSYGSAVTTKENTATKKPPGERREPTFDVSAFTKKAVGIKYVAPEEG